jgi:hypothetical protein
MHTWGLSQFNHSLRSLNLPTTPSARYAFYFSRMVLPEDSRIFTGFTITAQNYLVVDETPGKISYTFARQNIDFNVGYFLVDNEIITVPIYGGAGFSFLILNTHTNFNNKDKSFEEVLLEGSGTGIYNMAEISLNGSLITGIDFKLSYFRKSESTRNTNFNIGIRTGFSYAAYQLPTGITGVTGIPKTDRLNYFVSLNITRFLFPCN